MVSVFVETFVISHVAQPFKVTAFSGCTTKVHVVVGYKLCCNNKVDANVLCVVTAMILTEEIPNVQKF